MQYPRPAVAVIVTHRDRVLFGQRRLPAGKGYQWQLPGGWIGLGESPEQAARREVDEETGLRLSGLILVSVTNNIFSTGSHSISLCFEAKCIDADALTAREPEKCPVWQWKEWDSVTDDLFHPLAVLKQSEYRPFATDHREVVPSN